MSDHSTFETEPKISLSQAAGRYPGSRGAERTHPATLTRWILRGFRLPYGHHIHLEAVKCGSRWLTSEAALERFFAALTAAARPESSIGQTRGIAAVNRAAIRAGLELDCLGVTCDTNE